MPRSQDGGDGRQHATQEIRIAVRLLLDEDVPVQLLDPPGKLLPRHQIDHVARVGWKGKLDPNLLFGRCPAWL